MTRIVTEDDLRQPKWRGVDVADLEFRNDGAIVRKDRFVAGMRDIAWHLFGDGRDYEIPDAIAKVKSLVAMQQEFCQPAADAIWHDLKNKAPSEW